MSGRESGVTMTHEFRPEPDAEERLADVVRILLGGDDEAREGGQLAMKDQVE